MRPYMGAILAGGASRRFGSPKESARIGGRTLLEHVAAALREAGTAPVVIGRELGLPWRPDERPGLGPLGGILTALRWADETGQRGALCVAVDMPFVTARLLRLLLSRAGEVAVVPESHGPLGYEPLCAWYPVTLADEIAARLDAGEWSPARLPSLRLPLSEVERAGDPRVLFHNVNTVDDLP